MHVIAYADDAMLLVKGRSRIDIETLAERALRVVTSWSEKAKLNFSIEETSAMMLKNRFDRGRRPRILMNGTIVNFVSDVKSSGRRGNEICTTCGAANK